MSRVIQTDGVGKQRQGIVRALALAVRELMKQGATNAQTRDLVAFIVLAMEEISANIEETVKAWEKRGYWLKADRFRLEWEWCQTLSRLLREALEEEDWEQVAVLIGRVAEKISHVALPARHRIGTPWQGAWERLRAKSPQKDKNQPLS